MKILSIIVLLALALSLFAGCQSSSTGGGADPSTEVTEPSTEATEPSDPNVLYQDPLSEACKKEINKLLKYVDLDYVNYYYGSCVYGTINDCVIIRKAPGIDLGPTVGCFEVAGYMFDWSSEFGFLVYRDKEYCSSLADAYEKGWLTKKQIEVIHAESHKKYANKIRLASEIDLYPHNYYDDHYLYREPLSEQKQQEISEAFLTQCGISVDWDYDYTFYGTINGYAILMTVDQAAEPAYCVKWIGRRPFEWVAPFSLYAYKDGKVYELQEAYDNEYLDSSNMFRIRERNVQYYAAVYHS